MTGSQAALTYRYNSLHILCEIINRYASTHVIKSITKDEQIRC